MTTYRVGCGSSLSGEIPGVGSLRVGWIRVQIIFGSVSPSGRIGRVIRVSILFRAIIFG